MEKDTQKTVIEIKDLRFSYDDGETDNTRLVLKGVDLCVKKGEFLAILGHNGSGKSTLAKHLNAIFVPKSGTVTVEGLDTADDSVLYDIRQKVGMVFQNPDNQLVATIVEEDVAFAPENLGIEPDEIRKRVDYALDAVNMTKFAHHAPHMLSGGQKQRIAIAGVLAMKPDILVMDEPTAMLDPVGRQEIMNTVRKLNKEENITVIMITHFMEEAALADRIVVMDHGEAVMEGTPKEIFSQVEKLKKIGLDVPQTTELLYCMKKSGFEFRDDLLTIDECVNEIMSVFKTRGGAANG